MDDLDIFEITGTLSKSPTHCADHLINPLFRSSGRFPDHLDTFQIIRTLFRSSGRFSDHLVTFQIIWTLFRSSGHFSDHLELSVLLNTFQIIRKFSDHAELPPNPVVATLFLSRRIITSQTMFTQTIAFMFLKAIKNIG